MTSPGFAFERVLAEATPDYLRELLGHATCELLELVDGGTVSPKRLLTVAAAALEPEKLLADPERRAQLLALLPVEKRSELALRLGAESSADAGSFLGRLAWNTQQCNQLFGFYGLLVERAPEAVKPPRTVFEPSYGLFAHQRLAAQRIRKLLYRGERRAVLHLPTGVGKTRTAMHLICDHLRGAEPTTVVWLAHGRELLEQAAAEFEKAWGSLGNREISVTRAWGSGVVPIPPANDGLMVMSLEKATAVSKTDSSFLDRLGLVTTLTVFDEAHQAVAPTYRRIADALSLRRDASLLGLTATPGRTWSDIAADEELARFFAKQKVVLEVDGYTNPVTGLIDQGYLAHPTFSTVAAESGMLLSDTDRANLIDAYELPDRIVAAIGESAQWNLQVVRTVVGLAERHRRILLFAASIEHSRVLVALLASLGLDAEQVTGESTPRHRDKVIARFKGSGPRPMVLSNYGVLTTGFDAPAASAAVIARPTLSLVLYSQMVGRVLRGPKAGGTPECEVVTVVDPTLPGFGNVADAFINWEDVWVAS